MARDDDNLPEGHAALLRLYPRGDRLFVGTYTPPAPYRVFRLIKGGAQKSEPSRAVVANGDSSPTPTKPPHQA